MRCPVCSYETLYKEVQPEKAILITCPKCGKFAITAAALVGIEKLALTASQAANLSGYLRENPELTVNTENLLALSRLPELTISDCAERLLSFLSREAASLGTEFQLIEDDGNGIFKLLVGWDPDAKDVFTPALAVSRAGRYSELRYLMYSYLSQTAGHLNCKRGAYSISPAGWNWIHRGKPNVASHQAFIAMSFSASLLPVYTNAIQPAIQASGYSAFRIDRHEHVNRIDDEIIASIRRSRFCVADFAEHKAGVYFEAGFALGLGLAVIWTCSEPELSKAHFDTRQYNAVVWKDGVWEDFRNRLTNRIVAVVGQGPLATARD